MDTLCEPCNRDEDKQRATGFCQYCDEYLCDKCRKIHHKIKQLQSHIIIDNTEVLRIGGQVGEATGSSLPHAHEPSRKQCLEHVGKVFEYYCTGCNVLTCSECVLDEHKGCNTAYIPNINVSNYGTLNRPDDTKALEEAIDKIEEGIARIKPQMQSNISEIKNKQEETSASLTDIRNYAILLINELFDGLNQLTENIATVDEQHCNDVIKRSEEALNTLRDQKKESLMKKGKPEAEAGKEMKTVMRINTLLQSLPDAPLSDQTKSHRHSVETLANIHDFLHSIVQFVSEKKHHPVPETRLTNMSMDTETDTNQSQISGAMVTGNKLIVADRANKKVKVFDSDHNLFIAELKLPGLFQED